MLLDGMIVATTNDHNGIEFVSRDVEWSVKWERDQTVGSRAR
jgi:hypothetical protein